MTMVRVKAIEPCDMHKPGAVFEVTERVARELVEKRLVKMLAPVQNKMAQPAKNKANPSPAAGRVQPSSASPVAHRSRRTTAKPSDAGELPIPKFGG